MWVLCASLSSLLHRAQLFQGHLAILWFRQSPACPSPSPCVLGNLTVSRRGPTSNRGTEMSRPLPPLASVPPSRHSSQRLLVSCYQATFVSHDIPMTSTLHVYNDNRKNHITQFKHHWISIWLFSFLIDYIKLLHERKAYFSSKAKDLSRTQEGLLLFM